MRNEPFRTEINSNTAQAGPGYSYNARISFYKNSRKQDCRDKTITDVRKPKLLLQNRTLDPIGDAMWPTVM